MLKLGPEGRYLFTRPNLRMPRKENYQNHGIHTVCAFKVFVRPEIRDVVTLDRIHQSIIDQKQICYKNSQEVATKIHKKNT
jgi:hypothetical protein